MPYITLGFWLPCGSANFFNAGADGAGRPAGPSFDGAASVYGRACSALAAKGFGRPIALRAQSEAPTEDDRSPGCVYFLRGTPGARFSKAALRIDSQGFYLFSAGYEAEALTPDKAYEALQQYVCIELLGGDSYKFARNGAGAGASANVDDYISSGAGLLNFFQLNLIVEGMFNSTFDARVYFGYDSNLILEAQKEYRLSRFFERIMAPLPSALFAGFEEALEGLHAASDEDRPKAARELERVVRAGNAGATPVAGPAGSVFDVILDRFASHTANLCLQPLKWNIETCRRSMLRDSYNFLQRRERIDQLKDESLKQIVDANASQIRGYVLLVSAKFPLIQNVQRYFNDVVRSGRPTVALGEGAEAGDADADLPNSFRVWNFLIAGISNNIAGVENAINSARMDKVLYELEELRSEQEAELEIKRAEEHLEWKSTSDEKTFELSENGVMFALLAIMLTFAIYPYDISSYFGFLALGDWLGYDTTKYILGISKEAADQGGQILTNLSPNEKFNYFVPWSIKWLIVLFSPFVLYPVIKWLVRLISFHFGRRVLLGYVSPLFAILNRRLLGPHANAASIRKYQYEIDARVEQKISSRVVVELRNCKFSLPEDGDETTFEPPVLYTYRVERSKENDTLNKFHFVTSGRAAKKRGGYELKCHLIYEVLAHRISNSDEFVFQEFRFICTNRHLMTAAEQDELKRTVVKLFVNAFVDNHFEESDAIFAISRAASA